MKTTKNKSIGPKVARSADAIMKRLYPPFGIRPETEHYKSECARRGLQAFVR